MHVWLKSLGVHFRAGTTVTDIATSEVKGETLATELTLSDHTGVHQAKLTRDDLVFFTNGSLTQNSDMGDKDTVAKFDRQTTDRGCFTVWESLAACDPKFGRPETFLSHSEQSNWVSFFPTITADPTFFDYIEKKTGDRAGTGGAITIVDSSWKISFVLYSKYFPDQPADVNVLWALVNAAIWSVTSLRSRCASAQARRCSQNCSTTAGSRTRLKASSRIVPCRRA
jgi:oleate hydratase